MAKQHGIWEQFNMSLALRNDKSYEMSLWQETGLPEIKKIYGRDLSQGEFDTFVQIGRSTGLNPFLREIWAVKYGNSAAQIFIGRDGYRRSAQANPAYDYHHVDAIYSNDDFHFDLIKGEVNHHYKMSDRGKLIGAYCLVKNKKSSKPTFVYVDISEYNKGQSVWKDKPATMIKKVAEAQGLRMAFQELFGGTYSEEEDWNKPSQKPYVKPSPIPNIIEGSLDSINSIDDFILDISQVMTLDELQETFKLAYKKVIAFKDKDLLDQLIKAKDKKKEELMKSFEVIDGETGEVQ